MDGGNLASRSLTSTVITMVGAYRVVQVYFHPLQNRRSQYPLTRCLGFRVRLGFRTNIPPNRIPGIPHSRGIWLAGNFNL